jgi:hypothetical protein
MENFYFTFIQSQETLKDKYVKITAKDELSARNKMVECHGTEWGFCYKEKEFQPQITRFGLKMLAHVEAI